jgi:gamma-glutamyltranspeptidase/glutathione hydrolase
VRAITLMHVRHGQSRWEATVAPAERLARLGVPVSRALSRDLQAGAARSAPTARRAASSVAAPARR